MSSSLRKYVQLTCFQFNDLLLPVSVLSDGSLSLTSLIFTGLKREGVSQHAPAVVAAES